jgi:DNA repair photolyase
MAYILQSTQDPTLYFVGTILKKTQTPVFDTSITQARKFGSTIIFRNEDLRNEWEPGAPSISSRYEAVKKAHELGIFTWVSIEPVIVPEESLKVIQDLKPFVNLWKVGKLNHFKEIESKINWKQFFLDAKKELEGCNVYWKKDLLKYA